MNVVVSAIVDPWVTTLSFVVALAMRIQGEFGPKKVKNAFSWSIHFEKEVFWRNQLKK